MGDDAWPALEKAIRKGKADRAAELLAPLDEPARRALSKRAVAALHDLSKQPEGGWGWNRRVRRLGVAQLVAFATAGPAAALDLATYWAEDHLEQAVRSRSRAWRQDWADRAMADDEVGAFEWKIVHALVRDGLIDEPDGPGYPIGAVSALTARGPRLVDTLRSEPEWLATTFWRLFELEDAALAGRDTDWARHGTWQDALVALAGDGTVPRDRLLDAALAALRRDFSPYNARWFHQLFAALEPTDDELAARADDVLALLASDDSAVVGFALKQVARLEASGLDADAAAGAFAAAVVHPTKSHAARAVRLAGRVLRGGPETTSLILDALAHDAREVQEAALKVLAKATLTDADRARLGDLVSHADPALRAEIAALAGVAVAAEPAGTAVALPPAEPAPEPRPRLVTPLRPVSDLDDLLARLAVVLARGDDPDEAELVLDGISRLRTEPLDPGRAAALADQSDGRVGWIVRGWLRPDETWPVYHGAASPTHALSARLDELRDDLASGGPPRALLCAPTHAGGWIDPQVAIARVAALDGPPLELDLAQLVLRLAPDGREDALAAAQDLDGEAAAVLVTALGGVAPPPRGLTHAFEAAQDAAEPGRLALPDVVLGAPPPVHEYDESRGAPAPRNPTRFLLEDDWAAWTENGTERWMLTFWPAHPAPIFRIGVLRLGRDDGARLYELAGMLDRLADRDEPLGAEALRLIALALGCSDGALRLLAVDVALAALTDRRLDGLALGAQLGRLLDDHPNLVPSRWAETLGALAAAGPLGAHEAQRAIEAVLAADRGDRKRLLKVVDVLRTVAVGGDCAVADPAARAWLEALPPKSKTGRAARETLAVTGDGAARSRAALAEVRA